MRKVYAESNLESERMDKPLKFTVERKKCIQCSACIRDCPRHIIEYRDHVPDIAAHLEGSAKALLGDVIWWGNATKAAR